QKIIMKIKIFFLYLLLAALLPSCSLDNTFIQKMQPSSTTVRVAVLRDASSLSIKIHGPYSIFDLLNNQKLSEGPSLASCEIFAKNDGIHFSQTIFKTTPLKIIPQRDASIFINDRRFRGEIDLVKDMVGNLIAINIVDLEQYVKGVLAHEVSDRWPLEAIKAQAVAARTYALYIKERKKDALFDLTNDIFSQVYGGQESEKYRTNIATDQTRGLILIYSKEILPAYYHATCGGYTESVSELWGQDIPPLRSRVCTFCKDSPHYFWKKNVRLKDIQDSLNDHGYNLGLIKDIQVIERNQSQRIKTLKIITRDDAEVIISGKDFRNIIGPNLIRSNNYAIEMKGYYADFLGKGWGHGVGLCQWGAKFMAGQGYRFDQILKFYYPGVEIVNYRSIKPSNQ
ncbi:MAG: SpoIID/LytB domain-containing protein, partial [Candidatus Omnitrophica bacterium]|nr:SpoIID/LytB domain-containing protein [Candidatus Omnitrophota bacterium]